MIGGAFNAYALSGGCAHASGYSGTSSQPGYVDRPGGLLGLGREAGRTTDRLDGATWSFLGGKTDGRSRDRT